jgi:hypothetical protein
MNANGRPRPCGKGAAHFVKAPPKILLVTLSVLKTHVVARRGGYVCARYGLRRVNAAQTPVGHHEQHAEADQHSPTGRQSCERRVDIRRRMSSRHSTVDK